jgi:hypothetical protein
MKQFSALTKPIVLYGYEILGPSLGHIEWPCIEIIIEYNFIKCPQGQLTYEIEYLHLCGSNFYKDKKERIQTITLNILFGTN